MQRMILKLAVAAAGATLALALQGCAQSPTLQGADSARLAASGPATPASIERLFEAARIAKISETIQQQAAQVANTMFAQVGVPESDRAAFEAYQQRVQQLVALEFNWSNLKGPMADIYTRHYSEAEIQGMIAYYESPVGRSVLDKTPVVARDSFAVAQDLMRSAMPKLQALAREFSSEMAAKRAAAGAGR
ncbi:MAG: DUF2059 domain-containing protein [Variovorax sp.]